MNHINARELLFVISQLLHSTIIYQQSRKTKTHPSLPLIQLACTPHTLDIAFNLSENGKYLFLPRSAEKTPQGFIVDDYKTITYNANQRTTYSFTSDVDVSDGVLLRLVGA